MTKQAKIELIKKLYKEGKIKKYEKGAYSTPVKLFVLGITPKMVSSVLD